MDKESIKEELQRLGYWKNMYEKPDVFGTGQTKFADISFNIMKKHNVKTVLELGCGQGRDSLFFSEKNFHVMATDFSENAIKFVKETSQKLGRSNINTKILDMTDNFEFENKFDCIYSNLALQFFDEKQLSNIFKKISNVLTPNGIFLFSTKKPGDKYHKVGVKINDYAYSTRGITRYFFESETIENLLKNHFEISNIGNENHVNLDNTVSAWWYFITKKI